MDDVDDDDVDDDDIDDMVVTLASVATAIDSCRFNTPCPHDSGIIMTSPAVWIQVRGLIPNSYDNDVDSDIGNGGVTFLRIESHICFIEI